MSQWVTKHPEHGMFMVGVNDDGTAYAHRSWGGFPRVEEIAAEDGSGNHENPVRAMMACERRLAQLEREAAQAKLSGELVAFSERVAS
jgi:hypothetical protein